MGSLLLYSEFLTVLIAHALVGIFSMPLRIKKSVAVIVWIGWVLMQAVIMTFTSGNNIGQTLGFVLVFITTYIGQYLLFIFTARGRLVEKLFILLTYSNMFCIYMGIISAVIGISANVADIWLVIIRFVLLVVIVGFFLKKLCPMYRKASHNIRSGWWSLVLVNVVFLLAIIGVSVYPIKLDSVFSPQFFPFLLLSVAVIAVYPAMFLSVKNMSDLAYEKSNRLNAELLMSQIDSQAREVALAKQSRHDLRHHNQQMLALLEDKDYDGLKNYLLTYTEDIDNSKLQRFCENETVNNVLRVYLHKAQANGITMEIVALAEKNLPISSNDIVTILANIVENAYNGALKSKHSNPYIAVNIDRIHERLVIRCRNSCKTFLSFEDEMPEELRGIGVNSIISTVEKYGGNCRFTAKNGEFSCVVIIEI